ncbi:Serine/threonine receptor-like kinase NFP [Vitis vinifera]|uniref:Serine/threonine receptor-like kinase NFP n=1 Tax=Vitis vinifera TaxID=29760 RepID=A0A438GM75_VITVI|nr:Serine/threonine receptor-like kinase NFP [Vitis vinifera]
MTVSLLSFVLLLFISSTNHITAQSPATPVTNFSCTTDSPASCQTYVIYRAQAPGFLDVGNISDLFGISRLSIAEASNLASEEARLSPDQLLLVPILCSCTGNHYFANITYKIKTDDSFYFVSVTVFENLTNYNAVEALNPGLEPTTLQVGVEVVFPLFCKCPSKSHSDKGINYLITYVWQPGDDVLLVGTNLKASPVDIRDENNNLNFSASVDQPVLIPVSQPPLLTQPERRASKGRWILALVLSTGALLIFLLVSLLVYTGLIRKKKTLDHSESSLETTDLIKVKKAPEDEKFELKIIQDKLLPGVSGYLGKPIMYETKVIMEATMNLNEHYRIGGSVYRATINGQVVAVKKTKEDITEELRILQKWLHPKPSSPSSSVAFLTWSQRIQVALDVANGLQYMHEHTQPSVVHRDIRANNILLDSRFKAKIANFSMATPAMNSMMPKVDVFAFGVVLLELLSGKKAMQMRANGEIVMLWKDIREILEVEDKREDRIRRWMDPTLENFYPFDGALNLAGLARSCTQEKSSARPSMAEIAFNLSVLSQTSSETLERSWTQGFEPEETIQIINPVIAR